MVGLFHDPLSFHEENTGHSQENGSGWANPCRPPYIYKDMPKWIFSQLIQSGIFEVEYMRSLKKYSNLNMKKIDIQIGIKNFTLTD